MVQYRKRPKKEAVERKAEAGVGESTGFRSSVIGGFNREDVVKYIGRAAAENNRCREECERLRKEKEELRAQNALLEGKLSALESVRQSSKSEDGEKDGRIASLEEELRKAKTAAADAEREKAAALEKAASLEEAVKSGEELRERVSKAEYEACLRARQIEEDARREADKTIARAAEIVEEMKRRYEDIRSNAEVTAAHLKGEMSKMGDRISLVTEVMDRAAEDLEELDGLVPKLTEGKNG